MQTIVCECASKGEAVKKQNQETMFLEQPTKDEVVALLTRLIDIVADEDAHEIAVMLQRLR